MVLSGLCTHCVTADSASRYGGRLLLVLSPETSDGRLQHEFPIGCPGLQRCGRGSCRHVQALIQVIEPGVAGDRLGSGRQLRQCSGGRHG